MSPPHEEPHSAARSDPHSGARPAPPTDPRPVSSTDPPSAPPTDPPTDVPPPLTGLSADEVLDIVDEEDRVVGTSPRGAAYAQRLRHRAAFILVRDAEDRIFVHRRTDRKLVFPSHYDMFVGGVVGTGETYDETALREAEEELGVSGLPQPIPLFRFLYEDAAHGSWWSAVYEVRCDRPVRPQPEEVAWHAFLTEDELAARLPVWDWVPDGLAAYQRLLALRAAPGSGSGSGS